MLLAGVLISVAMAGCEPESEQVQRPPAPSRPEPVASDPPVSEPTQDASPRGDEEVEDAEPAPARPSAERVVRRAMALCLVMYRSSLEDFPGETEYEKLHDRLPQWIDKLGLASELEKEEHDLLLAPLGKADERVVRNASWRNEGLGILAWALRRFELPEYDDYVDPVEAGERIGFNEDLLAAMDTTAAEDVLRQVELRPAAEIDRYAAHITIVNWRLRTFRLVPEKTPSVQLGTLPDKEGSEPPKESRDAGFDGTRMDFVGYLRAHPSFKESWLNGLTLVDGDLAIGGRSIDAASREYVDTCASIAVERQIAAYWLQGDHSIYSGVDPTTILLGLGEGPIATEVSEAPGQQQ